MLTISTDGYPLSASEQSSNGAYEECGRTQPLTNSVENGVELTEEDKDEIMTEVEEAEVSEDMTIDMENNEEETVKSSEANNPTPTAAL
ncbi:serine/threonine-protein phosphatase 4 regulatory subunit 2 [Dorcoceras hygrometricum]|uniref:Serine/threonine-protein phosphatase 4 regulatory subunit 2 n=1 Tax=Dorcoceras hygrometricum TaxID=472368 RepID=A0A2Z7C2L7_9LAMI|nr:serine/threonine-protein phosphatase 4 regulatory subunit 2 [Dorcoceras hygrometricum]